MSKTITCPHCTRKFDPIAAAPGQALGEYESHLAGFGGYAATVRDYIDLFATKPGGTLQISTRLRLAKEITKLWQNQEFDARGVVYKTTRQAIMESMNAVVRQMAAGCGFKNHNYLKKVLLPEARQAAAGKEHAREQRRKSGQHRRIAPTKCEQSAQIKGDQLPAWKQPLEAQTVAYACIVKGGKMAMSAMRETHQMLAESLTVAGVDLERLDALAKATENASDLAGRGPELLRRCRSENQPQIAGKCMPDFEGIKEPDQAE